MNWKHVLTAVALLALAAPLAQAAPALPTVPRFSKFEASFTLPNQTGNPFDPAQNDVQVIFRGPNGTKARVPAFWDGDGWKVRYAPPQVGRYALTVLRSGRPVAPRALTAAAFRCVASADSGFVRRDWHTVQRLQFDNGRTYYPLGMDQAWTSGGLPDYPEMFALMHNSGLNWARVWMTYWDNKALDWAADKSENPPRGTLFLQAARRWDTLMDAAAKNGIYVQMCLQHHGQYTNQTDPNWQDNPANVANGGYLQHPEDFFTDPQARRLTKAKYRYIVARWGYATHLMAFELFNEVQNIGETHAHFENVVRWHQEMAAYLRSVDSSHHLITTSYSNPLARPDSLEKALTKIGLDYDQIHAYVPDIIAFFATMDVSVLKTPVFVGEWGPSGGVGLSQRFLHDGLWASLTVPTAGAAQFWYWDAVDRNNWWRQFGSAAAFVRASGVNAQTGLQKRTPSVSTATGRRAALSFAPPGGWESSASADVTIAPNGRITGLSGVSSFIQGRGHRDMLPKPIQFHLQSAAPCQFQVVVGTVARAGAHPEIRVDDRLAREADFAASEKDHDAGDMLIADVPAGEHTVSLFNTGADWFTVRQITVTNYAPALAALAKGSRKYVLFWAYNRDRTGSTPASGTLVFPGMAGRTYTVHLWDTESGKPLGEAGTVRTDGGNLRLSLPPVARDVAGFAIVKD